MSVTVNTSTRAVQEGHRGVRPSPSRTPSAPIGVWKASRDRNQPSSPPGAFVLSSSDIVGGGDLVNYSPPLTTLIALAHWLGLLC